MWWLQVIKQDQDAVRAGWVDGPPAWISLPTVAAKGGSIFKVGLTHSALTYSWCSRFQHLQSPPHCHLWNTQCHSQEGRRTWCSLLYFSPSLISRLWFTVLTVRLWDFVWKINNLTCIIMSCRALKVPRTMPCLHFSCPRPVLKWLSEVGGLVVCRDGIFKTRKFVGD